MAHRCDFCDRIELRENKIIRIVTAKHKEKKEDVYYEELESEKTFGRYVIYSYMAGYLVTFPNERISKYGIIPEQDFEEYYQLNLNCSSNLENRKDEFKKIEQIHPELHYLLKKISESDTYKVINNTSLFAIIRKYWKHPELENLIMYDQLSLARDERFYKLSKSKLKQILSYVKDNYKKYKSMTYNNILFAIKNNIPYDSVDNFKKCKGNLFLFKYLLKQKVSFEYYTDYLEMAKKAGHDLENRYWKFPNNLVNSHNKVLEELNNIKQVKNLIMLAQLSAVSKNVLKSQCSTINGFTFYIPQDYNDIADQAKELNQCLIRAGYVKKVIKQESILIFVKQGNKRIGTIEIDYSKKILQAYGNELDRNHCSLSEEILQAAREYIKKLTVRRKKYKIPDTIFFKGLYENDSSFNKIKFEEGKTYCTETTDEELKKIGSKAMASNKVFHFCKDVEDVKGWISNPSSYAIVIAKGPIVSRGTAFGSNKIKIKKIMTTEDVALALLAKNLIIE